MVAVALIGLFSGLLIGKRYRVFALLPVMAAVAVLLGATSLLGGLSWASAMLDMIVIAAGLQSGYLAASALGALLRSDQPARPITTPF